MHGAADGRTTPRRSRPALVLLNPRAANGRAAALAGPLRDWLAAYAPGVPLIESDSIERSRASLQCLPRSSRVVLVGGDGTLHHMLPVLLTHRLALGVVALGVGNDTARAIGVAELPWAEALQLALHGPTRRMDVGELMTARGRVPFISCLEVGFDAAVGQRVLDGPDWLDGRPRRLWSTLAALRTLRTPSLRARVDGTLVHDGAALLASVFNTPGRAGDRPTVPGARVADGRLDLLLAGAHGRLAALKLLPRLLNGRGATHTFQALAVDCDEPLPMSADGEPLAPLREFEVRVRASAIAVVSTKVAREPRVANAPAGGEAGGPQA
jgi:diacylglycerol kinase (ATP)